MIPLLAEVPQQHYGQHPQGVQRSPLMRTNPGCSAKPSFMAGLQRRSITARSMLLKALKGKNDCSSSSLNSRGTSSSPN